MGSFFLTLERVIFLVYLFACFVVFLFFCLSVCPSMLSLFV